MAGYGGWRHPDLGHPNPVGRHARQQHDGLRVGGQSKYLFRSLFDQGGQVFTEGVRGFLHSLPHHRVVTPGIQHANRLRSLAWKNKGKWCHEN